VFTDAPPEVSTAARHYFVECLDSAGAAENVATVESEELAVSIHQESCNNNNTKVKINIAKSLF
jgi:hypothetical protein